MPALERVTATAVEAAFRGVKRACYAGYDSLTLRREILLRSHGVLPREAFALGVTDPDTGLLTDALGEGLTERGVGSFLLHVYPQEEARRFLDLARDPEGTAVLEVDVAGRTGPYHSPAFVHWMREEGMRAELRASFGTGDALWGTLCLMREASRSGYTPLECDFVRRIVPHVANGLRAAALMETSQAAPASPEPSGAAGVLVVDTSGRVQLRNPAASRHLEDLDMSGCLTDGVLPAAATMLIGRLRARHCDAPATSDASPLDVAVRMRGRSGRWYRLSASLGEPGADGRGGVILMVEPLGKAEMAPLLARLYGLTPRERQVVSLVARGESTRKIAWRLGVSPYTVQDHVDHACDKVGVRGRKRLVARLFLDTFAEGQSGPPAASTRAASA